MTTSLLEVFESLLGKSKSLSSIGVIITWVLVFVDHELLDTEKSGMELLRSTELGEIWWI